MIGFQKTEITGCYVVKHFSAEDNRGLFVKNFHASTYKKQGLCTHFIEDFYSWSHKNVLRGFHFQLPTKDHHKLVTCLKGRVLDVVLDLRQDSPTYGQCESFELSPEQNTSIYISKGLGHAFLTLEDDSLIYYKVSEEHSSEHETGIRWDSVDFNWPCKEPILSARDLSLPKLVDFEPPTWRADEANQ